MTKADWTAVLIAVIAVMAANRLGILGAITGPGA